MQLSRQKGGRNTYVYKRLPAWLPAWPIVRVVATAVDVSWPKFSNKPQDADRLLCTRRRVNLNRVSRARVHTQSVGRSGAFCGFRVCSTYS